eukprot:12918082-Prorocentrum_lima.AAC.1
MSSALSGLRFVSRRDSVAAAWRRDLTSSNRETVDAGWPIPTALETAPPTPIVSSSRGLDS